MKYLRHGDLPHVGAFGGFEVPDWNDLDYLSVPSGATGDYGIHMPVNAWPGAAADVVIGMQLVGATLYQTGHDRDQPTTLWQRNRNFVTEKPGPWSQWVEIGGGGGGLVGGIATFIDGTAELALPDWQQLVFDKASGAVVGLEAGGDLRIETGGASIVEFRVSVTHSYGRYVIFGAAVDAGAIVELGRVQINSSDPVAVDMRAEMTLAEGSVLALYISSDFEYQQFGWSGGEVDFINPV